MNKSFVSQNNRSFVSNNNRSYVEGPNNISQLDDGEKSPLHHWKNFYKKARDNDDDEDDEIEKINEEMNESGLDP